MEKIIIKIVGLCIVCVFFSAQKSRIEKMGCNQECHSEFSDSCKWARVVAVVIDDNLENENYGQMVNDIYKLVYNPKSAIGVDKKMELLILLIFFQESYLEAYWSVVMTNPEKYDLSMNHTLGFLFSPYKSCPKSISCLELDSTLVKKVNNENKLFLESADSLFTLKEVGLPSKYRLIMTDYIFSSSFYEKYKEYLKE